MTSTFAFRGTRIARLGVVSLCALLAACGITLVMAGPANACSCAGGSTPEDAVSHASGVFVAKATQKISTGSTDIYEFDVSEVFKGNVGSTTTVGTQAAEASCGTSYRLGEEYLLFVSRPYDVRAAWEGYSCGPRESEFNVREVTERVYGAARPPAASAPVDHITWWTRLTAHVGATLLFLMAALTIGVISLIVVIVRPPRR